MTLPKQTTWFIYWTDDAHLALQCEEVTAKSPKVALRRFATQFPKRTFRGMSQLGGMPVGAMPDVKPKRTKPAPRSFATAAAKEAVKRPFIKSPVGWGERDLRDRLQGDKPVFARVS